MSKPARLALGSLVCSGALLACGGADGGDETCEDPSATELRSHRVEAGPEIDGLADDASWTGCRSVLEVEVSANIIYSPSGTPTQPSYPGLEETKVRLQSVHTDTDVYFLAQWDDPTLSLVRHPWEKQSDGTWKRLANKDSSAHENTYYEDKFSFQWDVNTPEFGSQGCYANCHLVSDENDPSFPGQKYNKTEGTVTDLWHWKSVRSNPNFQLDDQYVVYLESIGNGRKSDALDSGGYKDNLNDEGNKAYDDASCPAAPYTDVVEDRTPCFMGPSGQELVVDDEYWIFDEEKQDFSDSFAAGDMVAGMITTAFVGSRGDIEARAEYADGKWTLEVRRSLTTDTAESDDVQFSDLDATYPFGVAVFDNTQINHAIHAGKLELTFER